MNSSNYKIKCLYCKGEFEPRQRFCGDNCRKRYNEIGRKRPKVGNNGDNRTEASAKHLVFNIEKGIEEWK